MLKRLLRKLLHNPDKQARQLPCVTMGASSLLLPEARLEFQRGVQTFKGRVRIGEGSMLACQFVFESDEGEVVIGDRTFINGFTRLISRNRIEVGSDVTIAWGCTLYDHNSHSLDWRQRARDIAQQWEDHRAGRSRSHSKDWSTVKSRPIKIHDKAWIGFDCIILNGVELGEGCVVSAGSVVRQDVPAWSIVAGNPAVVVGQVRRPGADADSPGDGPA
jgi:acetyltransferase-like isoleucine patch superfamily enzyme